MIDMFKTKLEAVERYQIINGYLLITPTKYTLIKLKKSMHTILVHILGHRGIMSTKYGRFFTQLRVMTLDSVILKHNINLKEFI